MKKSIFPIMLMMVVSAMSFTSCTQASTDEEVSQSMENLESQIKYSGTWENDVYGMDLTNHSLKSISLNRRPQNGASTRGLTITEIKNGKKTVSTGTWSLTGNNQVIEMKFNNGERGGKKLTCKVLKSTPKSMTIEFDGRIYTLRKNL